LAAWLIQQEGVWPEEHLQRNAAIQNQDDECDEDSDNNGGGELRRLVTAIIGHRRPLQSCSARAHTGAAMGFNKRKMEDARRQEAEKEAAALRATDRQILEDAEQLVTAWNERQAKRMPMLFSPTIGAAITAGFWFLRAQCPACRTTGDVDLRTLDWHRGAAVTALTPALSCRSCRPNAPFAELVCLSKSSVAEEYYADRSGNRWVSE
jgi:hypothetical protein